MRILLLLALLLAPTASASPPIHVRSAEGSLHVFEGPPATAFLVLRVNATPSIFLAVEIPPGSVVDALTVNGEAVPWRYGRPGHLTIPIPENASETRLHVTLPGAGPWSFEAEFPDVNLAVVARGAEVSVEGGRTVVRFPADSAAPAWLPVLAASVLALAVAVVAAARDRRAPAAVEGGLLEHLNELQRRLRLSLLVLGTLVLLFAAVGAEAVRAGPLLLPVPRLGEPTIAGAAYAAIAEAVVPAGVQLVVLRPVDAIAAQLWLAVLLGVLAALPVIAYELAAFFGPALLPNERSAVLRLAPLIVLLFAAGALFAWRLLIPFLLDTLYGFAPGLGATPLLAVPDLVGFVAMLVLAMGIVFQLPVLMAGLARAGVVPAASFARRWRHALVGIFLVAALVTPDPTIVGQLVVAVPMTLLYGAGVAAAYAVERR